MPFDVVLPQFMLGLTQLMLIFSIETFVDKRAAAIVRRVKGVARDMAQDQGALPDGSELALGVCDRL